jgi:hypothetical protein
MPKAKPPKSCHLKQIVVESADDIFSTEGDILTEMCVIKVGAEKKIQGTTTYRPRQAYTLSANSEKKKKSVQILLQ